MQCRRLSYLLWAPESLMYNGWGVGPSNRELRLLVSADNYGLNTSFVLRTYGEQERHGLSG